MKNRIHFKIALLRSLLISAVLVGTLSCAVSLAVSKNKRTAMEPSAMKNAVNEADMSFMNDATEINLEEIRLSEVALERSKKTEIRELGKKLTTEHYKALLDLTALASRKDITIPTMLGDKENADYEKLNHMTGEPLDREYVKMMVKEHQEAITLFEKESKSATDPDIRQWASATLPQMHTHLDYAIACQGIYPMCTDTSGH